MSAWLPFKDGASIGTTGSSGTILADEEHPEGARITLEKCTHPPFELTCGVYGLMFHTRFFATEAEGRAAYEAMKPGLADIATSLTVHADAEVSDQEAAAGRAVDQFVRRFP